MRNFELNIGLAVGANEHSMDNTLYAITDRANHIENELRGQMSCKIRREWSFEQEPTLVVRGTVSSDDPGGFHQWLHQLAERWDQDCIAVYYPGEDKGYLLGPNAEAWGDFHYDYFVRYES